MASTQYSVPDLLRVMERLRDPVGGCPWDIAQDFASLVPSTLEECYELAQAIEQEDYDHVAEELGDVLFQVIFYAQLGSERDLFSFDTIVDVLVGKLLRRHPHVFASGDIEGVLSEKQSIEDVRQNWEAIKQGERNSRDQQGIMADVPVALPALPRAQKLQKRAAQIQFDWQNVDGVLNKLDEELAELRQAMTEKRESHIREEMGDILFTCVNLARHLGLDAEQSLRHSSSKFEHRFRLVEVIADEKGMSLGGANQQEMDDLWRQAKAQLSAQNDL